jgi:hypothetical protein
MDGMRLESGISQHVLAKFFHKFAAWMVEKYFEDNVHMPNDTAELESVETVYSLLGLPGCVGSMDGVHFARDNCHAPSVPAYKGKENFPTMVYNVTCDHARRVMSVHGPFPGARNDKSIARMDLAVRAARFHSMYLNFRYPMYGDMGASYTMACTTTVPYILWYACLLCLLSCLIATVFHVIPLHI